jgi:type III pantothenate kinase
MSPSDRAPLIAIDVGNSRIKCGRFERGVRIAAHELPLPTATANLDDLLAPGEDLALWLDREGIDGTVADWWIGSVHRAATSRLVGYIRDQLAATQITLLCCADLPLEVRLPRPDMVGIDRLLGGLAASRLRAAAQAAIVVDLGTAVTVDAVAADGAFLGGAIMPGIGMTARAFHEFTDLLPLVDMTELSSQPPALGTSTQDAIRSGLFWGAVGGVRELIERLSSGLDTQPLLLLTGGAAPSVAQLLDPAAVFAPHLVLSGIALAAGCGSDDD